VLRQWIKLLFWVRLGLRLGLGLGLGKGLMLCLFRVRFRVMVNFRVRLFKKFGGFLKI
jgi:hypothetical protein